MGSKGWLFATEEEVAESPEMTAAPEPVNGATYLQDIYFKADPQYGCKFRGNLFYPEDKRGSVDELNWWVYDTINNGVYKSGIATKQGAHEDAVTALFASLDRVEGLLKSSAGPYLLGEKITEADVGLYTTIFRFDAVYVQHFKCNIGMIQITRLYIHKRLRHLYWDIPAFKQTTNLEHIKTHYTKSHARIIPTGITPLRPLPHILPQDVGNNFSLRYTIITNHSQS
ncbi:unnamed protein product [Tuber melanosporum]|uniref:(Perigord truffle) hypothetical protein n=1 Tax=Tuber melanosporum (strain Mel28) TaxID=656061 RepID=D5GCZ8_TUBMM|nr:uncharacterized protein GSTUM_00006030001 [Tuber melanosporum]CAZ82391.1 unnamed protein product [Tuber melanosporum]